MAGNIKRRKMALALSKKKTSKMKNKWRNQ
jgi:hypothetical protein